MRNEILEEFLDGLGEGESRQLVRFLSKRSFVGDILTAEGQAHLKRTETLIQPQERRKSKGERERQAALAVLIEAEREAQTLYGEIMARLSKLSPPSAPDAGGGYGPVNAGGDPTAWARYNAALERRSAILEEAAEARDALEAAQQETRDAARNLRDGPQKPRRLMPAIFN